MCEPRMEIASEKSLNTSPKSDASQVAENKTCENRGTNKYKSKNEKKKARRARRKANKAKFSGNPGKVSDVTTMTETDANSLGNEIEKAGEILDDRKPQKSSDVFAPVTKRNLFENQGESTQKSRKKKCRHLAVAIRREDRIPVDKDLARLIRKRLTDLISVEVHRIIASGDISSGRMIKFVQSGLVSAGFFLVTPATEESRDWLLSRDFGLLDGTKVVVRKLERKKSTKSLG